MQCEIRVDGLADIAAAFREIGADIRDVLPGAAERAMLPVEALIKEKAPVQTGHYRDSWSTQAGELDGDVVAKVGTALLVDSPGEPGSRDMPLGVYLEYGTGIYAEDGSGRKDAWSYVGSDGEWHTTRGMPAQPHVRPAFDEERDRVGPRLRDELAKALEDALR